MAGYYKIRSLIRDYSPLDSALPPALDVAHLDIELGGIIAIVGGSGSGKTTLLNLISGLEAPDRLPGDQKTILDLQLSGDESPRDLASRRHDAFPFDKVSYVFQQGYLLSQASISVNLAMTRRAAGYLADKDSLEELLEVAQLNEEYQPEEARKQLSDRAVTLSGGQQQRINIARALGREPEIIFADELSSSLDPDKAEDVLSNLQSWTRQDHSLTDGSINRKNLKRTILWVTHDYSLASKYADAILVLNEGNLAKNCTSPIELGGTSQRVTAETIQSWVQQGEVPQSFTTRNIESQHVEDVTNEDQTADNKNKKITVPAWKLATGNIGSGITLSLMEAFRTPLRSRWTIVNGLKQLLRPLLGFSGWVKAIQLGAILALIMIITYGQKQVIRYFDQQLNDPSLRHVIVNQNMRQLNRTVINDESMQQLSADIGALSTASNSTLGTDTNYSHTAFPRHTETVDAYPEDVDDINTGYVPEFIIGVMHPDEPVYASLAVNVIDESQPSCQGGVVESPASLIPYADELLMIVSQQYFEQAKKMYGHDFCSDPRIDLWDRGSPKTFRIAGFVEKPPADSYEQFDALMQMDVWQTWYSRMDKRQMISFPRAAVYFNQSNHTGVINHLRDMAFSFDGEIINKFERLMTTSSRLRNTFMVISYLTLAVAATVAAGLIWGYLLQNAKSIAVLRAHNAWIWPLSAAIPFQLLLTFIYALVYILIGCLVWNLMLSVPDIQLVLQKIGGGAWQPAPIRWEFIAPTIPRLAMSLLVMLLVGFLCLFIWRVTHRKLAHELRQAY